MKQKYKTYVLIVKSKAGPGATGVMSYRPQSLPPLTLDDVFSKGFQVNHAA
jgi:hypothetical protein